jgi:hypothetical protein
MHHGGVETPVASDAALASVAQGGDAEALAVLFERYRPSLYAAADANAAGVQASIVGVLASSDLTVLEIDFSNPPTWPDHCPPQATFGHRLRNGRSRQLRIHSRGSPHPPTTASTPNPA